MRINSASLSKTLTTNLSSLFTTFLAVVILATLTLVILSCSPKSPKNLVQPDFSKPTVTIGLGQYSSIPSVDILFVVDNSGSMNSHQKTLSDNIDKFIDGFGKKATFDYHIGVITSDMPRDAGQLWGTPSFITSKTPDGLKVLKKNVMVGTNGHWNEEFYAPIFLALGPNLAKSTNAGFLRENALLVIFIITDTNDLGFSSYGSKMIDGPGLWSELVKLKGGEENILIYGVLNDKTETRCDAYGEDPVNLREFLVLSKGIRYDLCDPNFGARLAEASLVVQSRIPRTILLRQVPLENTIVVTYGSQIIPNDFDKGWTYNPAKNSLELGRNLELKEEVKDTQIKVTFTPADV